jgi:hypothetical protein
MMEDPSQTSATQAFEGCDWDQLQEKFTQAMEEHNHAEQALQKQAFQLIEVFLEYIRFGVPTKLTKRPRYSPLGPKSQCPAMKIELLRGRVLPG